MIKYIVILIIPILASMLSFSQVKKEKTTEDCYSEKIRLYKDGKAFTDTVVFFRNYDDQKDKKIFCDEKINSLQADRLIWESKYIENQTRLLQDKKSFIVSYQFSTKNDTIASFYISDKKSRETGEMMRFLINNNKIKGVNILPCCGGAFIPVEQVGDLRGTLAHEQK